MLFGWVGINQLFLPLAAEAAVTVSSTNVVLHADIAAEDARDMVHDLERLRQVLADDFGSDVKYMDPRVEVVVYDDPEHFATLRSADSTVALYFANGSRAKILVDASALDRNPVLTRMSLRHEYVHHYLEHNSVLPRALWMNEGLAEYYSAVRFRGDEATLGTPTANAVLLLDKSYFPIAAMSKHVRHSQRMPLDDYATAWLVVHKLRSEGRIQEALRRFAAMFTETQDGAEAFKSATGMDIDDASDILGDYLDTADFDGMVLDAPTVTTTISISDISSAQLAAHQLRVISQTTQYAKSSDAMKTLEETALTDPATEVDVLLARGAQELAMGSTEIAIPLLEKAYTLDPDGQDVLPIYIAALMQRYTSTTLITPEKISGLLLEASKRHPQDLYFDISYILSNNRTYADKHNTTVVDAGELLSYAERARVSAYIANKPEMAQLLAYYYMEANDRKASEELLRHSAAWSSDWETRRDADKLIGSLDEILALLADEAANSEAGRRPTQQ